MLKFCPTKKASTVLLRAARIADRWRIGGCASITEASRSSGAALKHEAKGYLENLRPGMFCELYWWGFPRNPTADKNARVIGLLLAAEMAKDDGR